ncbi:hypothetical protein WJX84_009657 [Apatococcus fuscideae]|uniref:Fe2OG dioxygenase domain-containing protein n=1 Tax=Apatococcus fuscideae TaxID=2026836 RepID=A0AAW1T2B9_9CHLO
MPGFANAFDSDRNFTSLPIIDIKALVERAPTPEAKAQVGAELVAACRDVGFFYVTGHGIAEETYQGILQLARAWFQLPEDVKKQIDIGPQTHFRGYQGLGANVTRYDGGFQRDWHEAIDLYKEVDPSTPAPAGKRQSPIHGSNQWPSQLPAFDRALRGYLDTMLYLGSTIMRGIAIGLGLAEDFFEGERAGVDTAYWVARVIHYPPLPKNGQSSPAARPAISSKAAHSHQPLESGEADAASIEQQPSEGLTEISRSVQLSCGEHSDYGLLTIGQPGRTAYLRCKPKTARANGCQLTPSRAAFVCNIGDMLKVWTNGLLQPTVHRVLNTDPSRSRVSIPFFYEPAYEAIVEPLPQLCSAQHPAQHAAIRYGDHLEGKVLNNFEL